ncbi:MAG: hypothetical protein ABL863_12595 [Nitrosomonas sp.]
MTMQTDLVSEEVISHFHPELQDAVRAVNLPEVQDILKKLGKYGLGVALPHMHNEEGMVPLPEEMVSSEDNLKVSFRRRDDVSAKPALPVMWRCGKEVNSVAFCGAECGGCC